MKLNKILEAFTGKKEFVDRQERLVHQLQEYIGTRQRPDLANITGGAFTKQDIVANLEQKLASYEKAFKEYQAQDEKAFRLINTINVNFKDYRQELAVEVKEAEKFVGTVKDLLDEVER